MTRRFFSRLAVLAGLGLMPPAAHAAADPVMGTWWTRENESRVQIAPCGESICGTIVWMKEPNKEDGTPKRDANNPDEAAQRNTIMGLQILHSFTQEKPGKWEDGKIYNPRDGKTYRSIVTATGPDELEVEGCVLFLCDGQTWTRFKE